MIYEFFQSLNPFRRAKMIADWADLSQGFLPSIALVTQKTTVEYCRVKAGPYRRELFSEASFQTSLTESLKSAWPLVMDDFIIALSLHLSNDAPGLDRDALTHRLLALREEIAASAPDIVQPLTPPPQFPERLAAALATRPPLSEVANQSGNGIYAVLPLHADFIRYDREVVVNNVRLTFLGTWLALANRLEAARLRAALLPDA